MTSRGRYDSGLTLAELMVVCMLLGIVLAGAWSIMYASNAMSSSITAGAFAADESQLFIDRIGVELRGAAGQFDIVQAYDMPDTYSSNYPDADASRAALAPNWSATSLTFYADLNGDGLPERITYYMSGHSLLRVQASAVTTNPLPCTFGAASTPQVVIKEVDPTWTGAIFVPLTGDDIPPTAAPASEPNKATAVQIQMRNIQVWGDRSTSYEASTTVRIRNKAGFG